MGNTESNPVKNIDKRTARREYHLDFSNAIAKYRSRLQTDLDIDQLGGKYRARDGEISVCVRKRPINKSEVDCCEFDVITTLADQKSLVVHDARMGSDMKTQYIEHYPFKFNKAFSEKDGNEAVYRGTAAALIDVAFAGQLGTCMMYGQVRAGHYCKFFPCVTLSHALMCSIVVTSDWLGQDLYYDLILRAHFRRHI